MNETQRFDVYRSMAVARRVDEIEQEMVRRGEGYFHVSAAGHEGSAMLAPFLRPGDWLLPHYRDKALMLARGFPARGFLDAVLCNDGSASKGRQISAHLSDPDRRIVSMAGPVGNATLHAAGIAAVVKASEPGMIVVCCLGDGTTQEGEVYEAIAETARENLPVLFVIEDNRWAISTHTAGRTFYRHRGGWSSEFHGIPIDRMDGRLPEQTLDVFERLVAAVRSGNGPRLVVMDVERLASHTNADDQRMYRDEGEIRRAAATGDPFQNYRSWLLERGAAPDALARIDEEARRIVAHAESESLALGDPIVERSSRMPIHVEWTHPSRERTAGIVPGGLAMKDAIRGVLRDRLEHDERVWCWGQDIEDPKGDVFGVTRGLSTAFPGRVRNAPLAEATIVGAAVGRALAGQRPVAFVQFADFLPLAFNQIFCEMGTMHWRSNGGWRAPVIVMAPNGGYRPGLGPFHSHSMESILAHVPGIDVLMPSTASDAAGLLNAAFASERPTLFLYPKSLLNDPAHATAPRVDDQFVPIGVARKVRAGRDITLVGWGNTVRLCSRVAETLESAGVEAEVVDLRSISPWDEHTVLASAERTARLLVVHEDNLTCGFGAEILATVAEKARVPVAMRRVARPDTTLPCNFANQSELLPSFRTILDAAADLLRLDVEWREPAARPEDGTRIIEAIGSGPSDEAVTLVEWRVEPGANVTRGQVVASLEATKSVFDLSAPCDGEVDRLHAEPGESVAVGRPLLTLRAERSESRVRAVASESAAVPVLARRPNALAIHVAHADGKRRMYDVGVSSVATTTGGRVVTNEELLGLHAPMTSNDVLRRTGIEQRYWALPGETAVGLAAKACWSLLDRERLLIDDLDLVICATTSPTSVTPSMACQVLSALANRRTGSYLQAYDINAACSGYLYALQSGFDFLQSRPDGRVLVVTAELLSPLLNPNDFDTSILFGDATSATVLYGESHIDRAQAQLYRPELSANAEDGSTLSVPLAHDGYIRMKGRRVFTEAVRAMVASLNRACDRQGLTVDDLALVVPHQANQRILDAIRNRIPVSVYSNIRRYGNTSSSSIPLCLSELLETTPAESRLGLCAFGGGFTFGAGILRKTA
ncbi:MAG: transketolase [Planctomycetes bacterium]|nr:transketolase [Planctomycetota bacterium]